MDVQTNFEVNKSLGCILGISSLLAVCNLF